MPLWLNRQHIGELALAQCQAAAEGLMMRLLTPTDNSMQCRQAESVAQLVDARTGAAADSALAGLSGGLAEAIASLRTEVHSTTDADHHCDVFLPQSRVRS